MSNQLNTLIGLRTDFSLGESVIPSEKIVDIAKRMGQTHVAIADTMSVSGLIDVSKKAQKEGIEVHIGARFRVVDDAFDRSKETGKKQNNRAFYPKVWARNEAGMQAIYQLLSMGYAKDRSYYVPRIGIADLLELDPTNVLVSTGDAGGVFSRPDYKSIWERLKDHFAQSLFAELVPVPTPYFERMNINALKVIDGFNGMMATIPTLFDDGGYDAFFLNMAMRNRSDLRNAFTVHDPAYKEFHPRTPAEVIGMVKETFDGMKLSDPSVASQGRVWKEAMTGNADFLALTSYRWEKMPIALPKIAADSVQAVKDACKAGVKDRLFREVFGFQPTVDDIKTRYLPRLSYELGVLERLDFCDYFLVVADLVNWAKSAGIMVGPGRGSVGGSLVAFLMGITDIDPIRFDLLFERFINPSRNDLPDADLDFMSSRREEIIRYLEGKYGEDKVAGISNYGVLQAALSVKNVARVHGMNVNDITCTKLIPAEHGQPVDLQTAIKSVGEIQKFAEQNPKVWKGALAVQGVMTSYGRHAAGTIVSGVPLMERAVVEVDGSNRKVNWDMRVCEDMGLVKLDVLGLSTLDTLSRCLRYIWERHTKRVDLLAIPLDDQPTLEAFSRGETIGVFQFEGGAARRILKDMASSSLLTFNDLVAANALNRPGPIDAGLVQDYVDARNGERTIAVPHPNMEPALAETYNVIVYQEQVMRIATDLCGFSLPDADKLRKAMGKKDKDLMATFRRQFVDGALSHSGVEEEVAAELFDQIEVFAGYAFNKSHAAEYSLISYQCMWLKVHFPVEFYAASLSTVDEKKLQVIVSEAKIHGITVVPPDINISGNEFVIGNDTTLYIPFNRVSGVSDRSGSAILRARQTGPFQSIDDLRERVEARACNSRQVDNLDRVGAFVRIEPTQLPANHESRRKDQMELLPGLMTGVIVADRVIPSDKFTLAALREIIREIDDIKQPNPVPGEPPLDIFHAGPAIGKRPKFMVVMDGPGRSEEHDRRFASGESFAFTSAGLLMADLKLGDAYWTGLVKRRKTGKVYPTSDLRTYAPFLDREVELLKPPLIMTLGSNASRHFVPDLKGDMMEHVGRTFWSKKLNAMILIGFNPNMCHFRDELVDVLGDLFRTAKSVILPDE